MPTDFSFRTFCTWNQFPNINAIKYITDIKFKNLPNIYKYNTLAPTLQCLLSLVLPFLFEPNHLFIMPIWLGASGSDFLNNFLMLKILICSWLNPLDEEHASLLPVPPPVQGVPVVLLAGDVLGGHHVEEGGPRRCNWLFAVSSSRRPSLKNKKIYQKKFVNFRLKKKENTIWEGWWLREGGGGVQLSFTLGEDCLLIAAHINTLHTKYSLYKNGQSDPSRLIHINIHFIWCTFPN